jgi:hypothetical protein
MVGHQSDGILALQCSGGTLSSQVSGVEKSHDEWRNRLCMQGGSAQIRLGDESCSGSA